MASVKTIIGYPGTRFDKQETSRRDSGQGQGAGTYSNPYIEDDWQIIRGVGWSSGVFAVTCFAQNVHSYIIDVGGKSFDFPFEEDTFSAAGSLNGTIWVAEGPTNISTGTVAGQGTNGGSCFNCALTGKVGGKRIFRAGGFQTVPQKDQVPNPPDAIFTRTAPLLADSSDGASYRQIGTDDQGAGTDFDTFVVALGFSKKLEQFYAVVAQNSVVDSGAQTEYFGVNFSFSATFASGSPPPIDWPSDVLVVDVTDGAASSDPTVTYASCTGAGQIMRVGDHTLELTGSVSHGDTDLLVDGTSVGAPPIGIWVSAAMGSGKIVATSYDTDNPPEEDNFPPNGYVFVSTDLGVSWTAVAPEVTIPGGRLPIVSCS